MSKILVTGGTGYIGSHTIVELINAGHEPVIIDNLSNSEISVLEGIRQITGHSPGFYQEDAGSREAVEKIIAAHPDITAIIHFAAFKAVGESVQKPLSYYRNNLDSTINLLECMLAAGIPNFVFSSSCTVYGQPDELPVSESAPIKQAESPYGNTKQMCEDILRNVAAATALKAISLRYFNPVGAHESALIGELPRGVPNNLMPFITQTAIGKREKLTVFGDDYDTPDGSGIRDYIHVVDLAKAHVKACERLIAGQNKASIEFFNLGTGSGYSVLEVIKAFEKVNGVKLNYTIGPRRAGDIEKVYADTSFSNSELGWKANLGLEEMVASAWKWEQRLADKK
ncbi:UDP-galactose 4-epimerase [Anseongella ginsenosidimutans]|uniref:UDP-glucose 4-epimerase n=1 Tax=Anseongella ginsenosidimutans TaxID=496056 RepID=A0A4R3KMS2_9SPHI|nr:UDP-glucose 4-epimerase GalE [Anseongella ginsenosidimutans]QEC54075.1 UDP-glucose 4-epimerase GalE [Anseongella ginsenosidimutans]TCS85159.1 UDP-galactose 4-epimerase [Anseongella ginsenosidimutans]